MVRIRDLKLSHRIFARTYRWRAIEDVPAAALGPALSSCRVALVSSAGLVAPGDVPFDEAVKGGDYTHRIIEADVDVQSLTEHHRSDAFDHSGIEADRNLGLPLDRLHELARTGVIGSVAPRHISLMGSITAPARLVRHTLPRVAELLVSDGVDAAVMVPV